jgi:hypothetical protein
MHQMQSGRGPRGSRRRIFSAEYRAAVIICLVVIIVGILIGGHLYGRYLSSIETAGREKAIEQLRGQAQGEKREADSLRAANTSLQAKLAHTQAALDAIMPSANTYNINPNQTLILGNGHLAVGLIGPPSNDSVLLNINGKPQPLAAGQTVNIAPDSATKCQVSVQSFDVFKAVLVASCAPANAQ